MRYVGQISWWGRRDSNPHALRHMILNHARLPVPTRPRAFYFSSGASARLDERPVEGGALSASAQHERCASTGRLSHERTERLLEAMSASTGSARTVTGSASTGSANGYWRTGSAERLSHERYTGAMGRSVVQQYCTGVERSAPRTVAYPGFDRNLALQWFNNLRPQPLDSRFRGARTRALLHINPNLSSR